MKCSLVIAATLLLASFSCVALAVPLDADVGVLSAGKATFHGQKLVRVPNTAAVRSKIDELELDVWAHAKQSLEVRVTPEQLRLLQAVAGKARIHVINPDIQKTIDREELQLKAARSKVASKTANWFESYHQYSEIVGWLQKLGSDYPAVVKYVQSIGKSVEGRDIPMVKITGSNGGPKKTVWLQSLQHAREWISAATTQYIINGLATGYGSDKRITSLLDKVQFVIVPVSNPDGYEYTWKSNRLWRKNRQVINGKPYGVDMNRNWPNHWGQGGSSKSPSSDVYMGPSPASEPEVKALIAAYESVADSIIAAVDMHSYSQLILRPYGFTNDPTPDDKNLIAVGDIMKNTIKQSRGTTYVNQRGVDLYVVTGGSDDWFYDYKPKSGIRAYGLGMELSPAGGFGGDGFILPPDQIIPVGKEVFPAVLAMAEYALQNPLSFKSAAVADAN